MAENPLGKQTVYPGSYQPELLTSIPRAGNRRLLDIDDGTLPFQGADVWNAYEISCLDSHGKPQVFQGRFIFEAHSPCLVESKSLKLYLNSLNQAKFDNVDQLANIIGKDLEKASGHPVHVMLGDLREAAFPEFPVGDCLDHLDIETDSYQVSADILREQDDSLYEEITDEVLYTNLFRSNCPITNQPDWATITVCYHGKKIPGKALLKYLVSYRLHNDYHENCIERIFCDLVEVFSPQSLTVEGNFLRRGGLDINPVRTTETGLEYMGFPRHIRQ